MCRAPRIRSEIIGVSPLSPHQISIYCIHTLQTTLHIRPTNHKNVTVRPKVSFQDPKPRSPLTRPRHILVTGATGFIGAHVVDNLLARGLAVRAATRSKQKGEQMKAARPQHASRLEFVEIQDFSQIGVFDDIMEGIDGVIHVASVCHNPPCTLPTLIPSNCYKSHSHTTPKTTNKNSSTQP